MSARSCLARTLFPFSLITVPFLRIPYNRSSFEPSASSGHRALPPVASVFPLFALVPPVALPRLTFTTTRSIQCIICSSTMLSFRARSSRNWARSHLLTGAITSQQPLLRSPLATFPSPIQSSGLAPMRATSLPAQELALDRTIPSTPTAPLIAPPCWPPRQPFLHGSASNKTSKLERTGFSGGEGLHRAVQGVRRREWQRLARAQNRGPEGRSSVHGCTRHHVSPVTVSSQAPRVDGPPSMSTGGGGRRRPARRSLSWGRIAERSKSYRQISASALPSSRRQSGRRALPRPTLRISPRGHSLAVSSNSASSSPAS